MIPDIRETQVALMEDTPVMRVVLMEDTWEILKVRSGETAPVMTENRIEVIFLRNRTAATEEAVIWQSGSQGLRLRESFSAV